MLLLFTGAAYMYISSSKCLWTLVFAARQNYRRVNANTLIGAAILFPGHPYIWATLPRALNTKCLIYVQLWVPPRTLGIDILSLKNSQKDTIAC